MALLTGRTRPAALPGPRGSLLLGSALQLRRDLLATLLRDQETYGDLVAYQLGPAGPLREQLVLAHHPDDVHQVMANTERTVSKDTIGFRAMADLLGRGLLTTEGDEWRRQRRMVQPLFTPRRVAGYATLMGEEAARIADAPAAPGHRAGEPVDLHLLMLRYTLRVVGRALFGDAIEDLVPVLHDLVPAVSDATMRRTFQLRQSPMERRTPRNRRPRRLRAREYAVVDEILSRSPRPGDPAYDDAAKARDDLVTRLRAARDPETGGRLSETEIRDQALIFLMAGHETTAGALTFTLHQLGRHPEVQERVAAEVADVLGDRPVPTADDLPQLPLTRAALMEGMRLYPSAHITERLTTEPMTLAGHDLPARTLVAVSPWSTQRHPRFWPEPSRFDPGRFLDEETNRVRPRYAYFPFGGGPRSCVGEHFAMLEAEILLAALLRRHRVTSLSNRLDIVPMITLRPAGEVPVVLMDR
ncbi:MAG: cytochrome P450 [Actinomycetota bacterium]|nr:cytochrome P450 [Actinomycetota bacterium]